VKPDRLGKHKGRRAFGEVAAGRVTPGARAAGDDARHDKWPHAQARSDCVAMRKLSAAFLPTRGTVIAASPNPLTLCVRFR
jgi:hypothetical protein